MALVKNTKSQKFLVIQKILYHADMKLNKNLIFR